MSTGDGLAALGRVNGCCHAKPEFWSGALDETKDFVEDTLKESPDTDKGIGAK